MRMRSYNLSKMIDWSLGHGHEPAESLRRMNGHTGKTKTEGCTVGEGGPWRGVGRTAWTSRTRPAHKEPSGRRRRAAGLAAREPGGRDARSRHHRTVPSRRVAADAQVAAGGRAPCDLRRPDGPVLDERPGSRRDPGLPDVRQARRPGLPRRLPDRRLTLDRPGAHDLGRPVRVPDRRLRAVRADRRACRAAPLPKLLRVLVPLHRAAPPFQAGDALDPPAAR